MVATQSNPVSIFVEIRLAVRKLSLEIIVVVVIRDAISTHQHHVLVMVAHIGLFGTTPIMQLSQNVFGALKCAPSVKLLFLAFQSAAQLCLEHI